MIASLAADAVLLLHGLFIAFAVLGAALLWRWPGVVWLHLPATAWGAYVEFSGKLCPLTPLENRLRHAAGGQGYSGGFVEHYLLPLIYPEGLTRETQWLLGGVVLVVNAALYAAWLARRRR
jgi:Protein of Unknown function (DUF2784)